MGLFGFGKKKMSASAVSDRVGDYRLQEKINSGGMADIWVATNSKGEPFAIKRMHHDLHGDSVAKKRFLVGCELLSRIHDHEHVIGYVGHGQTDDDLYLVMEYVEASNLKQLLSRSDPVLCENVGNILIDMAIALEHVHDAGYMHLDFKPENVLVTRSGSIRLVDFDLCQPIPKSPQKFSKNPGTPAYMAPEQLMRQAYDRRADIFAFGATAYEILTFKKPFPGENAEEVLRRQLDRNQSFIPPRELNPDIPFALEKAILKCLEKEPDKRYPYMSVLVRDLQTALYV